VDSLLPHAGSRYTLKLWGNTWKVEQIAPRVVDSGDVWQVAVYIDSVGEAQAFGVIDDSARTLLYCLAGTHLLNPNDWITTYQGAFGGRGESISFRLQMTGSTGMAPFPSSPASSSSTAGSLRLMRWRTSTISSTSHALCHPLRKRPSRFRLAGSIGTPRGRRQSTYSSSAMSFPIQAHTCSPGISGTVHPARCRIPHTRFLLSITTRTQCCSRPAVRWGERDVLRVRSR
jgi:hypothetical protein